MPAETINLAIVDDLLLFRKVLKNYLLEQDNINVLIQTSDISELFHKLKDFPVDVLLLDVFMSNLNALDVLAFIRREYPEIKVLIVSGCTELHLISELLDYGIHGYISKTDEPEELLQAILMASNNKLYCNKLLTEALYWNRQNKLGEHLQTSTVELNDREKKILQMLWDEKNNREIAEELFLSIRSIEKIRQDMKEKLGVRSTVGLLKYGISKKIIEKEKTDVRKSASCFNIVS
ncbi:response regulator transcription factor [Chitinophaga pinensis]|uniref:Two component transcriptional regulator, LuxR family n=1 Tax=Chitinophaga pinensis (strain ATCC 43595 / DSM 2588 / LMG 13176 / NBRC 15968 / NCIMB 11800 / UQM 2034) TaxID=485918 RepID=A0A979G8I5_CHIPD|nr:response regulator transcription factor [Chitinophaga pinensis]ACU62627.1 two component transcriptional regulator, LuxR family [Chitinophaga pinensis DSM 2588]